ncbi:MAG TPA: SIMPL domain-containing protein [bacterium]|nr:SIMPL domain-containing protein [bacterium]HPL95841.1 SIMPL domain-containing protein [bacterium]
METCCEDLKKPHFWFKLLSLLCVTAIVIVALFVATEKQDMEYQFSATATGKVFAKPDIANLTVGLKTEAKATAAEAVKENTKKMNEIVEALKKVGIEEKDIKTTNYSLNPVYDWSTNRQVLRGYEVYQNVTVKIRNLDRIGEAIAKTTEKGANQIGNVEFTIDDEFELKAEARNEAIEKAKQKAKEIAEKTGIKLGKIINVYENQVYYPSSVNYAKEMAYGIGGGGAVPAPEIQVGQNEVSVEVTVVWKVK